MLIPAEKTPTEKKLWRQSFMASLMLDTLITDEAAPEPTFNDFLL